MNSSEYLQNLLTKAAAGEASEQELHDIAEKLKLDHTGETTGIVESFLKTTGNTSPNAISDWKTFTQQIISAGSSTTAEEVTPVRNIVTRKFAWVRYAAAVIVIAGIGAYLWNLQSNGTRQPQSEVFAQASIIQPGSDRATLTLADGRTIVLDSATNGKIAEQSGSNILKNQDQVVYEAVENANAKIALNTMATPRGGQYKLTLSDGTKVWLNAESSITYPTAFAGKDRKVNVTGEVYFEVAKNKQKPFVVNVAEKMEVEVLGTHFNINSYGNEASVKTTLLEGSVRIIRAGSTAGVADQPASTVVIKPGEQAQLANARTADKRISVVQGVDLDQTMAWKNGIFDFNGLDIQGLLRQIERWYDVQVEYKSTPAAIVFKGEMYRNVRLSDVLEKLQEMSGIKFRMEGKKLFVL